MFCGLLVLSCFKLAAKHTISSYIIQLFMHFLPLRILKIKYIWHFIEITWPSCNNFNCQPFSYKKAQLFKFPGNQQLKNIQSQTMSFFNRVNNTIKVYAIHLNLSTNKKDQKFFSIIRE